MTNKFKYFIGNWKMYGNLSSFKIIQNIEKYIKKNQNKFKKIKVIFCVPSTLIYPFFLKFKKSKISIGGQNCHFSKNPGPFTGSLNAQMAKNVGAKYLILGHSENRKEGENNHLINKKIENALCENLNVIFCFGETIEEKKRARTFQVIKKQINECIKAKFDLNKILFAYEPVWSIGSGKTPSINDLSKVIKFIKKYINKKYKFKKFKILYGGSVNAKNIENFSKINEIDGFLIGGASLSQKKFIDIINNYYKKPKWKL